MTRLLSTTSPGLAFRVALALSVMACSSESISLGDTSAGAAGTSPIGVGTGGGGHANAQCSTGTAAGTAGAVSGGGPMLPPLVTSTDGAYWQTNGTLTATTAAANVTILDTVTAQTWEGFGGAFNELGWSYLVSKEMQDEAMTLLFSATDGAALAWGRIPIGANDYAVSRYTEDDTGEDPAPNQDESNRPAPDPSLANFSLARDMQNIIPYIKAAQAVNPRLRFWASPWTPPVWMKAGYMKIIETDGPPDKWSYYDGGTFVEASTAMATYAQYCAGFVAAYKEQGIDIEVVSPQDEPHYEQTHPSCAWSETAYVTWIGQYLGPAMKALGVGVMLGTLDQAGGDLEYANAVLADSAAKSFISVVGAEWGVLDEVNTGAASFGGLPVWVSEHKCGNYPWCGQNDGVSEGCPTGAYDASEAPNDQAYAVESWGYVRDAIKLGKVTAYNVWNMVLDKIGRGIDTSRPWNQDALLVANAGTVTPTPAYYMFRHISQYVVPGATVVGTTGGDALAFKNPDGSLVAIMFNGDVAKGSYVLAIGGKKFQFAMPGDGWATVKYTP